jgi:outer membrane receptor protein involved in Fe transport
VMAMAYDGRWNSTDQIAMRAVDRGEIGRFDSLDTTTGGSSSRYSLSGARYADFAGGRWEVDAYLIRYKLNLFSNFTYYLDRDEGDQFEQADSRTIVGIHPRATFFGKLGSFDTVNRIGLQGRFDDIGQVALYDTVARQRVGPTSDDKVRQGSVGIYGDNSTQWNRWFRSVVGLRADFYRFNVTSSTPANSGNLNDAIVSPKLSLIFGPWSRTEFFFNYGQGFHSNDARGTTITVDPKTGDPVAQVSPLVKSRGSEIGARTEFIPGLQSSLTLWQLKLDSELLFVGDAGTTEPTRPTQREGIEWSNHYVAASSWLVDLQLAWSKSRFVGDAPEGNYIPGSIVTVAAFGVTYDPGGKWYAALQTRYFGPRPLTEDNSVQSSSTNLTNMRLGYRIDKTWQVRLDLLNVFNRKKSDIEYYYPSCLSTELAGGAYANPACTGAAGTRTGVNDIHFHPVEPVAVRVTVSASF